MISREIITMDTSIPIPRILAKSGSCNPQLHKTPQGASAGGEGDPGDEWRQRRGWFSWKQCRRKLRRGHCVGRIRTRRGRHGTDGDERGAAAGSAARGRKGETAKETLRRHTQTCLGVGCRGEPKNELHARKRRHLQRSRKFKPVASSRESQVIPSDKNCLERDNSLGFSLQVWGFHVIMHLARKRSVLCNTALSTVFP